MSYILDALKKADAERARSEARVPGLNAVPAPMVDAPATSRTGWTRAAPWALVTLLVLLVAWLGWRLLTEPRAGREQAAAPDAQLAATAHVAPLVPASTPSLPSVRPETPAVGVSVAQPPASMPSQGPSLVPPTTASRPSPTSRAARAEAPPARPASSVAASPAEPVYTLQTLPESVRRDVPPLSVGGAMYSETPAQRMLILNSQVFREGDHPSPDLVLEEIRLRSAVFRFRGTRFSIAY